MDADLQDPPELLPQMFDLIQSKGVDCVGTPGELTAKEPLFVVSYARLFYKLINRISQTEIVDGARDYRLMTRQDGGCHPNYPSTTVSLRACSAGWALIRSTSLSK